jgi:hypothetical protein
MNKILSQNIHYGYVFTNNEGQYLSVLLRYIMSEPEKKIGDGCWEFTSNLVHYDVDEAKMVGWVIKDQKLKVKKQKIQISNTIELVDVEKKSK